MSELNNRYDFVYLFDVQDGNPNGDPDAGNAPRIDAEDMHGLVTDVCLKRKVRNYVAAVKTDEKTNKLMQGFDIFIREKAVLSNLVDNVYNYNNIKQLKTPEEQKSEAKKALCANYYDIRTFGAVIAETDKKTDQIRGTVQLTFARSVDPIFAKNHSITRMAVTKAEDKEKEKTMGRKSTVPYGLYVCHGFVSANLAKQTGFSEEDLKLFWKALKNMFDFDHSAARGLMAARKLIVFKHGTALGEAPASDLFGLVTVEKKANVEVPRKFDDYKVTVGGEPLEKGKEKKLKDKEGKEIDVTVEEFI